ncbi:MAG: hypothetical protein BWX86_02892 [Verrucomicrobia bacterium ADurb.Bin122]|nr:MAG: hypothetical protein BWX86_02892 [Verrucomicrobia bacterium ADurb.Bin122]
MLIASRVVVAHLGHGHIGVRPSRRLHGVNFPAVLALDRNDAPGCPYAPHHHGEPLSHIVGTSPHNGLVFRKYRLTLYPVSDDHVCGAACLDVRGKARSPRPHYPGRFDSVRISRARAHTAHSVISSTPVRLIASRASGVTIAPAAATIARCGCDRAASSTSSSVITTRAVRSIGSQVASGTDARTDTGADAPVAAPARVVPAAPSAVVEAIILGLTIHAVSPLLHPAALASSVSRCSSRRYESLTRHTTESNMAARLPSPAIASTKSPLAIPR